MNYGVPTLGIPHFGGGPTSESIGASLGQVRGCEKIFFIMIWSVFQCFPPGKEKITYNGKLMCCLLKNSDCDCL